MVKNFWVILYIYPKKKISSGIFVSAPCFCIATLFIELSESKGAEGIINRDRVWGKWYFILWNIDLRIFRRGGRSISSPPPLESSGRRLFPTVGRIFLDRPADTSIIRVSLIRFRIRISLEIRRICVWKGMSLSKVKKLKRRRCTDKCFKLAILF